jgi:predicted DNA-binding transcriptional regulator AlpA
MNDTPPTLRLITSPPKQVEGRRDLPTDLIDEVALATRLGVARSTLQSWRYSGRGPRYIKVGRLIRYRNAEIESYLRVNSYGSAD